MSRTLILASVAVVLVALTGRTDAAGAPAFAPGLAATTGAKTVSRHSNWNWALRKTVDALPTPTVQQLHDTFFGSKKDGEQTGAAIPASDAKVFNWRTPDFK
jgi:hypothetical protein